MEGGREEKGGRQLRGEYFQEGLNLHIERRGFGWVFNRQHGDAETKILSKSYMCLSLLM